MAITLNQGWVNVGNVGPMHCLTEKVGITFGICMVCWAKDVVPIEPTIILHVHVLRADGTNHFITFTYMYTLGRAKWRLVNNPANVMATLDQSGIYMFLFFFLDDSLFHLKLLKRTLRKNKENFVLNSHGLMRHKNFWTALLSGIKNAPVTSPKLALDTQAALYYFGYFLTFPCGVPGSSADLLPIMMTPDIGGVTELQGSSSRIDWP